MLAVCEPKEAPQMLQEYGFSPRNINYWKKGTFFKKQEILQNTRYTAGTQLPVFRTLKVT
jgi:hypothetical protein